MRRPLVGIALLFAAGIFCGRVLAIDPVALTALLAVSVAAAGLLIRRHRGAAALVLLLAAFVGGALNMSIRRPVTDPAHLAGFVPDAGAITLGEVEGSEAPVPEPARTKTNARPANTVLGIRSLIDESTLIGPRGRGFSASTPTR